MRLFLYSSTQKSSLVSRHIKSLDASNIVWEQTTRFIHVEKGMEESLYGFFLFDFHRPSTEFASPKQERLKGIPWMSFNRQRGSSSPRHLTNGLQPPTETLPELLWRQFPSDKKPGRQKLASWLFLERATRLELATSTLARWRSTR